MLADTRIWRPGSLLAMQSGSYMYCTVAIQFLGIFKYPQKIPVIRLRECESGRPPPAAPTGDSAGGRLVRPRLPAPTAFVGVSNRPASAATNPSKLAFGSISEFGFGAHQVGAMIHSA